MDREYVIYFEENDSEVVITIKGVWASSGEQAIEKAKTVLYYPPSWKCIGLDRVKE